MENKLNGGGGGWGKGGNRQTSLNALPDNGGSDQKGREGVKRMMGCGYSCRWRQ